MRHVSMCCAGRRYPSDDINKFLWMVRIGGGVFPDIKEKDYLGEGGYRVDDKAGKVNPQRTAHYTVMGADYRNTYSAAVSSDNFPPDNSGSETCSVHTSVLCEL